MEAALKCNSLFSDFAVIWVNPIYFPVTTNSASMHHIPFILDRSRCWKSVHSDNLDFRTMLEIGWSLCSGCYRGFRKLKFAPKRILWIFLSLPAFIIKVLQALKCTKKGAGNKKEACSRVRDFSKKKKNRNISILRGGLCIKQAASYANFDKIFFTSLSAFKILLLLISPYFYAIVPVLPTQLKSLQKNCLTF